MSWRPIETAPKDATWVLTWDGNSQSVACYEKSAGGWYFAWHEYDGPVTIQPTHWQPLPEPPQ